MHRQIITKLRGRGHFRIWYPSLPQVPTLEINFDPLIKKYNLQGDFVLIHWQSRPRQQRRWGIYSGADDIYLSGQAEQVHWQSPTLLKLLDLDEKVTSLPPSSVLLAAHAKVKPIENGLLITSTAVDASK